MKAHKFVVLEIHGKSRVSEHHFSTTVRMFCIEMRIMLFGDTYSIYTVAVWWRIYQYFHALSLFRDCLVSWVAQGHPDSWHRVTREGPVEPAALARWLVRERGSSLRHPACTASEDSGAADDIDDARKLNNNDKKVATTTLYFLSKTIFSISTVFWK